MIRPSKYNFEHPTESIQVMRTTAGGTAEGEITFDSGDVLSIDIEVYKCTPPNVENENWVTTGENLYLAGD